MYTPPLFPNVETLEELKQLCEAEFRKISETLSETQELELRIRFREPEKPRAGMIVYADGTEWNPGGGAGVYTYTAAGTWSKL